MKLLIALIFSSWIVQAQSFVDIRPVISTTTISTTFQTAGNDTITSLVSNAFASVRAGQQVFGPGIKIGTTVLSTDSLTIVKLSDTCSITQDSVAMQFGYFTSTAYTSGDWVGFPFAINAGSGKKLISAEIIDAADVIGATDIVFFNNLVGEPRVEGGDGLDNGAAAFLAANEWYVLGIVSLTTVTDLGAVKILTKDDINLQLPGGTLYGRLIARTGPTYTAITNLRVRLRFQ